MNRLIVWLKRWNWDATWRCLPRVGPYMDMSIDRCKWCSQLVDTDDEPEAYVELPTYTNMAQPANPGLKEPTETICLCHVCREDFYEKYGERE